MGVWYRLKTAHRIDFSQIGTDFSDMCPIEALRDVRIIDPLHNFVFLWTKHQVMDAILTGRDCIPLLKSARFEKEQRQRLLTRTAGALSEKVLGHDAALKALKALNDHGADLAEWLCDAIKNEDCKLTVFLPLLENFEYFFEFQKHHLLNFLESVFRRGEYEDIFFENSDDDESDNETNDDDESDDEKSDKEKKDDEDSDDEGSDDDESDDETSADDEKSSIIKCLVDQGLDINDESDSYGRGTPLIFAIEHGGKGGLKAVLRAGAIVDDPNHDTLIAAIGAGDDACYILSYLFNHIEKHNKHSETKIDINVGSDDWGTTLHYAAQRGVENGETWALHTIMTHGGKERPARGYLLCGEDGEELTEELTPTEFIKKRFEGDDAMAGKLRHVLDVIEEYRVVQQAEGFPLLEEENKRLQEENKRLKEENKGLNAKGKRLEEENKRLREEAVRKSCCRWSRRLHAHVRA